MQRSIRFFMVFLIMPVLLSCKTPPGKKVVYLIKVESGDTLAAIAQKYDTTPDNIREINKIKNLKNVKVGDVLRIQPGPAGLVYEAEKESENQKPKTIKSYSEKGLFKTTTVKREGKIIWPVNGEVSSKYGMRWGKFHRGIDITGRRGTKIKAVRAGKVEYSGWQSGYGRVVIVDHSGFKSLYAHCNKIKVKKHQWVPKGRVVGTVGTSGNARGPHLHFEVRLEGRKTIDPLKWLAPRGSSLLSALQDQLIERTKPYVVVGSKDHLTDMLRL